ncbi:hypothetical protein DSL72_007839 [Monilinia vaccinii-corymbosi]|uniref:Uncharacterized protein n=1 Tax=Monilinia vaccinii-corymbosi TaxID=61207 RepID=A0A8A3PI19_9HELO|nr:hypothetical protein DSL72_007839 [Monilinia vaccinii-corymbosi]
MIKDSSFISGDSGTIKRSTRPDNTSIDTDIHGNMSFVGKYDSQDDRIRIGDGFISKSGAFLMLIMGMVLGLFAFVLTQTIFDRVIRPRYFPALPSLGDTTGRSIQRTGSAADTSTARYGGLN